MAYISNLQDEAYFKEISSLLLKIFKILILQIMAWHFERIIDLDVLLYMCCFYWIMNKTVLANDLPEQSQVGNSEQRYVEKVGRVKEMTYCC